MKFMIITNNKEVAQKYRILYTVQYMDCSYREVLIAVRDYIHEGHRLLTHPLSGSVKPNETPYKSILISDESESLDMDSLDIIEKSMEAAAKFTYSERIIEQEILDDFRCIDTSLVDNVINKLF